MTLSALPITPQTSAAALQADLEQLWMCLDDLLGGLHPADRVIPRGRLSCVTPAAIPAHLAWFDTDLVLNAIARGTTVPGPEQHTLTNLDQLETGQVGALTTPHSWQQGLLAMRAARASIRRQLEQPTAEADLEQPIWWPLPMSAGWRTVQFALEACCSHTWNHVLELWTLQHGRIVREPSIASATHRALARYTQHMIALLDRPRAARSRPLTAVMVFTGPGGGAWTFRIRGGSCTVAEEWPVQPDVVITQTPETFLRTMVLGTEHQLVAVLAGEIRVQGSLRCAAAFRRLFPRPRLASPPARTPVGSRR